MDTIRDTEQRFGTPRELSMSYPMSPSEFQSLKDSMKDGSPIADPVNPENTEPLSEMPLIVIVIDELADLMMVVGKKIEELIVLIQKVNKDEFLKLFLALL